LPDFGGFFFFGQISISVAICSQEYKFFTKYLMSYARILVSFNFGVAIKKKVILLIFKLDSKSLEGSIGDVHTNIQSWGHGTHWIQHTKSKEK